MKFHLKIGALMGNKHLERKNSNAIKCTEEEHQLSRQSEFIVIETMKKTSVKSEVLIFKSAPKGICFQTFNYKIQKVDKVAKENAYKVKLINVLFLKLSQLYYKYHYSKCHSTI